jgi:hypothetical protein
MVDQCPLCERRKAESSDLCEFHSEALANLEGAFASWRNAYGGDYSKELYFNELETLVETGQAVKEVINHLRKREVHR